MSQSSRRVFQISGTSSELGWHFMLYGTIETFMRAPAGTGVSITRQINTHCTRAHLHAHHGLRIFLFRPRNFACSILRLNTRHWRGLVVFFFFGLPGAGSARIGRRSSH
ncbi:hypothetical protein DL93DRAFT_1237619 [Clavulina sp. PMI_390]|nr:hypothetical protein DL93DRAFT_1237619 [Clavulina sp. PMI_390]